MLQGFARSIDAAGGRKKWLEESSPERRDERAREAAKSISQDHIAAVMEHFQEKKSEEARRQELWVKRRDSHREESAEEYEKLWKENREQAEYNFYQALFYTKDAVYLFLSELIAAMTFGVQPTPTGRTRADASGALTEIAHAYLRTFGENPTKSKTGVFYALAVEIIGLNDPRRQVDAAVDSCTKPPRQSI